MSGLESIDEQQRYDAIVLGAGISGLVSAAILLDRGASNVLVVDEYAQAGGNHRDVAIGGYTFDVGSFIFQDDSPLLRWFPELMRSYVPIEPSWARVNPQGVVTKYPFSVRDDLLRAGPVEVARILVSVAVSRVRNRPLRNARDFAEHWLGPRLVERSGLLRYMERFCGMPAHRIDLEFAQARMGWIAEYAKIGTHLRRFSTKLRPTPPRRAGQRANRQLARPRTGFATLYAPVVDGLSSRGARFRLGEPARTLKRDDRGFVLRVGDSTVLADRVISTIPIDHALRLAEIDAEPLPTVTLISLFYSFEGERGFSTTILYNFSAIAAWKRLTVYSDFYGVEQGRTYFAVEVIDDGGSTIESAAAEFRTHTAANDLLVGDLRLEGGHVLEHAYPIYTSGSGRRAKAGIAALREFGVESFGRQGGFQYQPTARVATQTVEDALGVERRHVEPMDSSNSEKESAPR